MRRCLVFITALTLSHAVLGSTVLDSLWRALGSAKDDTSRILLTQQIARKTAAFDLDSAFTMAHRAQSWSERIGYLRGQAEAYYQLARLYNMSNQLDTSILYFNKSIPICLSQQYTRLLANNYWFLGNTISNQDDYQTAADYYLKAIPLFDALQDENSLMSIFINYAWVRSETGKYPEASEYLYKAIRLAEQNNQERTVFNANHELAYILVCMENFPEAFKVCKANEARAIALDEQDKISIAAGDFANYYGNLGKIDSSLYYNLKDLAIQQKTENSKDLALVLNNVGSDYLAMKEYHKAIEYFQASLASSGQHRNTYNQILSMTQIGEAYQGLGSFLRAASIQRDALNLAHSIGNAQLTEDILRSLDSLYRQTRQYELAYTTLRALNKLQDSTESVEKNNQMAELRAQYESEKQAKEIAVQKTEILSLEAQNDRERSRKAMAFLGLLALSILSLWIINRQRLKIRKDAEIRQQEQRAQKAEMAAASLEKEQLESELLFKQKELTSHTLHLIQKNELLEELKDRLETMKKHATSPTVKEIARMDHLIDFDRYQDEDWQNFKSYFNQVHPNFETKLKSDHPEITVNDIKLAALIRMSLTTKQIATINNVSILAVKKARYRLRKKLNISEDESLEDLLMGI
ncbi:MAG: tetratricopeptide repeat protein [Saprospiraceae bacterium]|nr:tetratricopeptide repeat protein [Saprospiraceae bacterium]MCB9320232.1 tetratricopeptide repeat protein [Lewinellaceae bacterium]